MHTGSCKWFNDHKAYGFITPDDGSKDCFVHFKALQMDGFKALEEGARVEYDTEDTPKGCQSINVRVLP